MYTYTYTHVTHEPHTHYHKHTHTYTTTRTPHAHHITRTHTTHMQQSAALIQPTQPNVEQFHAHDRYQNVTEHKTSGHNVCTT